MNKNNPKYPWLAQATENLVKNERDRVIVRKFLNNAISKNSFVDMSAIWSDTPQGHDYWSDIAWR